MASHPPILVRLLKQESGRRRSLTPTRLLPFLGLALLAGACGGESGQVSTVPATTVIHTVTSAAADTGRVTTVESEEPTLPELVARVRGGVVRIEAETCYGASQGTGFLIGPRLVATAEHVIDGAYEIVLKRGDEPVGQGTVVGADRERDLALIRSDTPIDGHVFRLANRPPRIGEDVAVLGFPLGLPLSLTRGSVSGTNRALEIDGVARQRLVQTDAAVNPGNSGGPLLELRSGKVVGVVVLGGSGDVNDIAFAVSPRVARPLLEAWSAAPQPVSQPSCAEQEVGPVAAGEEPDAASPPEMAYFEGSYFSVTYPASWYVDTNEEDLGGYLDTTIRAPDDPEHTFLRIDVSPDVNASDPEKAAAPVIRRLESQPSYELVDSFRFDFNGYDALWWEFRVQERGTLVHKVDIFFIDDYGAGFGLLTQAPESVYYDLLPLFDDIRASFSVIYE